MNQLETPKFIGVFIEKVVGPEGGFMKHRISKLLCGSGREPRSEKRCKKLYGKKWRRDYRYL